MVTYKEPSLVHLTLTDFFQVPFIEGTLMLVIRAERKIAELEPKAANAQLTNHCRNNKQAVNQS